MTDTSHEDGIEQRREIVLAAIRQRTLGTGTWDASFDPPRNRAANDLGKHWWPKILAHLASGDQPSDQIVVREGSTDRPVQKMTLDSLMRGLIHDAPDDRPGINNPAIGYLYFSPVGLGWVLHTFPDVLAEEDRAVLYQSALQPHPSFSALNMFTGEGTENHILMGRIGGYLISLDVLRRGPADPSAAEFQEEARKGLALTSEFFLETARSIYERGLGEYDSSTYYPYVLPCWLALYDFAHTDTLRSAARAVLDWMTATIAVRHTDGIFGGPEQRGGIIWHAWQSNLDQFTWIWWGDTSQPPEWNRQDFAQAVYATLSGYRPPPVITSLAHKQLPEGWLPMEHLETKPSYLTHGSNSIPDQSHAYFFLNHSFSLGTMQSRPTGGWTGGDSQDILWKLVLRPETGTRLPALSISSPRGRDPWRQTAQFRHVLFDIWHTPANAAELRAQAYQTIIGDPGGRTPQPGSWHHRKWVDFRKRFPLDTSRHNTVTIREIPVADRVAQLHLPGQGMEIEEKGPFLFFKAHRNYIAVTTVSGAAPIMNENTSGGLVLSVPVPGTRFDGFILEIESGWHGLSFEDFQREFLERSGSHQKCPSTGRIEWKLQNGDLLSFAYETNGTYIEPEYDWGFGADQPGGYILPAMPPFEFPTWPSGEGHGRTPTLLHNGKSIPRLQAPAVHYSRALEQNDRILRVRNGKMEYWIDYQGEVPVFSERSIESD